ncbi:MAG: hypothetical protein QOJ00_1062, partial [Actinomycetota bacterium]
MHPSSSLGSVKRTLGHAALAALLLLGVAALP